MSWLRDQSLKWNKWSYNIPLSENMRHCNLTLINGWGWIQQHVTITRSMDKLGREFLDFLDQASWCHVGMAGSSWLHRCGMGCHRHWCWGCSLNSWCGRNSWGLVCLGCKCCRCSRCGLHVLCRLWQFRLCHQEVVSSWSLWCGSCATWDSVNHFDTTFMKVSPCVVVCGTIAGVYLVAVLW